MNKKLFTLVLLITIIGLVLSGCTRSATSKSPTDASPTVELPFPQETVDTSAQITEIVRQTQNAISTPYVPPVVEPQASNTPAATSVGAVPTVALPTVGLPTVTKAPVIIPTITRPATYTIQQGEWPICIARRYNLELDSFLSANNMDMNSSPPAGTVLVIPETGTWSAGDRALKTHPADYTVTTGDTIYSVACEFGDVDPMAIVAANNLKSPYTLTAGAVIQIP
ncbi:MAG: LysM peptidoglycan-binding domain-containing protein [Bellilinea sp.]